MSFENFIDERMLISRDALGKKEMKIKVLEVSDETAPVSYTHLTLPTNREV